jgi:hypothetical protein
VLSAEPGRKWFTELDASLKTYSAQTLGLSTEVYTLQKTAAANVALLSQSKFEKYVVLANEYVSAISSCKGLKNKYPNLSATAFMACVLDATYHAMPALLTEQNVSSSVANAFGGIIGAAVAKYSGSPSAPPSSSQTTCTSSSSSPTPVTTSPLSVQETKARVNAIAGASDGVGGF